VAAALKAKGTLWSHAMFGIIIHYYAKHGIMPNIVVIRAFVQALVYRL
jgi:hypothetical protein